MIGTKLKRIIRKVIQSTISRKILIYCNSIVRQVKPEGKTEIEWYTEPSAAWEQEYGRVQWSTFFYTQRIQCRMYIYTYILILTHAPENPATGETTSMFQLWETKKVTVPEVWLCRKITVTFWNTKSLPIFRKFLLVPIEIVSRFYILNLFPTV